MRVLILSLLMLAASSCIALSRIKSNCPVEDASFCSFVRDIEKDLTSENIESFLGKFELLDCKIFGGGPYGPTPEDFCGEDIWCVRGGIFAGEGYCLPLSQAQRSWDDLLAPPVAISGLIYTYHPTHQLTNSILFEWPAIILKTYDAEMDAVLLTAKEEDRWIITDMWVQRKGSEGTLTPMGIVIPWQWPFARGIFYWLGMEIPLAHWRVEAALGEPKSYGVLSHRELSGCNIHVMDDAESFLRDQYPGLKFRRDSSDTPDLKIDFVMPDGEITQPSFAYYDIYDRDLSRLIYFLVEAHADMETCARAFYELLATLRPSRFPKLPVPQG